MRLPSQSGTLNLASRYARRQTSGTNNDSSGGPPLRDGIVAVIVCVSVILVTILTWLLLRQLRARQAEPRWIPGAWLKRKWRAWQPTPVKQKFSSSLAERRSNMERSASPSANRQVRSGVDRETAVDRHTSVRSIMTLPEYSTSARPTEQVIAREGERGGIDTVLEFPETIEEEESRRDEEMESLYQIRVARRAERQAREERRRLRREARARGDTQALEELRQQGQGQSTSSIPDAATMLQEHHSRDRGRRVSSVSYAELGVARHDGTRVRANSAESDNQPLLESAATMDMRHGSEPLTGFAQSLHLRNQSGTSLRPWTPDISDDEDGRAPSSEFESLRTLHSRAVSASPSRVAVQNLDNGDLGAGAIPHTEPPQYDNLGWPQPTAPVAEEAPPYESPTTTTAPRLGALAHLPSIHITPFSPILSPPDRENGELGWGR